MIRPLIPLVLAIAASGCMIGPTHRSYKPAFNPAGVQTTLEIRQRTLNAELLEVQDNALLVLNEGREVLLVPYRSIRRGTFEQPISVTLRQNIPSPGTRNQLRLLSRFPQGVSPQLLENLLSAYGQAQLPVVEP